MLSEFSVLIIQFGFSINNEHQELSQKAQSRSQQKRAAEHPSTLAVPGRSPWRGWLSPRWFQVPSSPPDSTTGDTSEDGGCVGRCHIWPQEKGVLQASKTRAPSPWEAIPWTTMALRPWSGRDADAQPGTGSVTKGSASWCLLHLCSTLLSHTHGFFKTQI